MWTEVVGHEKELIVRKLRGSYEKKVRVFGVLLNVPFTVGFLAMLVCAFTGKLVWSNFAAGLACLVIAVGLIWFSFFRIKLPFDTDHVYVTEPMIVDKMYRHSHNRNEAGTIVVQCGNMSARKIIALEIGNTCRFLHCGNKTLHENYELDCRFAVTDAWLSNF